MNNRHTHKTIAAKIETSVPNVEANSVAQTLAGCARHSGAVQITPQGSIVARTGKFTGRSVTDKFIVDDETSHETVWWDNSNSMSPAHFDRLLDDMLGEATTRKHLFRQNLFAGADPDYRLGIDLFTDSAWHALFIRNLLIRPAEADLKTFQTGITVLHLPGYEADPARHGTRTSTCIALDFTRNIILICGTAYAGEIKKSVFSLFNFHAPARDVLPMHCSANVGPGGDATLFFGLSGTGKTTLSSAADRALVGDDEHGWSDKGIFNLEGGCYAKAINLSADSEPEIFAAALQPNSVLENVTFDAESGVLDFTDDSATENTRIAYPLTAVVNRVDSGIAPAPKNIVLLTADAFGVLPPIARLSRDQAIAYFLAGYTAKVAGTERGVTEPQATFSACFGAPFMARHPAEYGKLLAGRLEESGATCWLLNTGWTGGAYGTGHRMALGDTRHMLEQALSGALDEARFRTDSIFGLAVPETIEGIDAAILDPVQTWADPAAYRREAEKLRDLFAAQLRKLGVDPDSSYAGHLPNSDAA